MSRPYLSYKHTGFLFKGNRIHPDELGFINAQLAEVPVTYDPTYSTPAEPEFMARRVDTRSHRDHNLPYASSILERLHQRPDIDAPALLASLGRIAARVKLPDHWKLSTASEDSRQELARQEHLDLFQALGETALESNAA